ncbi:four helix bundle protein [Arenibacter sp. BSSL-BM3]|uniref:Four helix bundle protein n=1 Tax=Arenibacter arenosicollis TaxID=2762274 RepID=A0ABR7QNX4_9FLAO|nr:four helix bundle protein [Arenibacter arenosicollis]MBC8768868.1 four helix bundle protein [Arenibacter arenosicollis]
MGRHNFKKLKIWQEGMKLVSENFKLTKTYPDFERFNLISQMNRCAVSIPSNISEGSSKSTNRHFIIYLENSLGSAFEWETQLIVSHNENYLDKEKFEELENKILQIQKMIASFIDNLGNQSLDSRI